MALEVSGQGRSAPVVAVPVVDPAAAEPAVDVVPPELPPDVPVPDALPDEPPVALSPAPLDEPPPDVEVPVAFTVDAVVHAERRAAPSAETAIVRRMVERY